MNTNNDVITSKELESMLAKTEAEWAKMDAKFEDMQKKHMLFRDTVRRRFFELITIMKVLESHSCDNVSLVDGLKKQITPLDDVVGEDFRTSGGTGVSEIQSSMTPVTIHFVHDISSDRYQPFVSWIDYVIKVVLMCIKRYGKEVFLEAVLDRDSSLFGELNGLFVKVSQINSDITGKVSYKHIVDDVYIQPIYGPNNAKRVISILENKFPLVKSDLIYI